MKVLIAEDNSTTRSLLAETLRDWGFDVVATRDGLEAWEELNDHEPPELILLDYLMPGMSGSQFLERKRRDPGIRGIPVVVLSAWTREWTPARLDAVDVLSKPVDLDRLMILAAGICDGSHRVHAPVRGARRMSYASMSG